MSSGVGGDCLEHFQRVRYNMGMIGREELNDLIKKLDEAKPCEIHGREHLCLCMECKETVHCYLCDRQSCQCWNDE